MAFKNNGHGRGPGFGGPQGGPGFGGPGFGGPHGGPAFGGGPSRSSSGSGLFNSIAGAAVGVASAAIVNKMHENSQMKMQEKQAEQEMKIAQMQAEQATLRAEKTAQYNLEMEKLKVKQEEVKLEAIQPTKRYHANCPYCMGVNTNGSKVCDFCGSSLAYYDEADNK